MGKYAEVFKTVRLVIRTGIRATITINPDQVGAIVRSAKRTGFVIDQSFANLNCGWVRLYNVAETANGKIYESGAIGIQMEWRFNRDDSETATLKFWKNV